MSTLKLRRITRCLTDLIYPRFCTLCYKPIPDEFAARRDCDLCEGCIRGLTFSAGFSCQRCGFFRPLERLGCHICELRRYHFERTWVLGEYANHLKRAVLAIKSSSGRPLANALGALLSKRVRLDIEYYDEPVDVVIPVPTHWKRRLVRRGSSVDIIAKQIASALSVRCPDRFLKVTRIACKQGTLDAASRRINVKDLFAIRQKKHMHAYRGKSVLLVDDIMTSGATLNELSLLLLRNGVRQVRCATVARGAA
jgi:ComF family protein